MSDLINVLILVASNEETIRNRFQTLLRELRVGFPDCVVRVDSAPSLEKVHERLKKHYVHPGRREAMVVSDLLTEDFVNAEASSAARELFTEFSDRPYTAVAILKRMGHGGEIDTPLDIDRAVSRDCDAEDFRRALLLCFKKLVYLARPPQRRLKHAVEVKPIGNLADLLRYFKLRHRVYMPMANARPRQAETGSGLQTRWALTT